MVEVQQLLYLIWGGWVLGTVGPKLQREKKGKEKRRQRRKRKGRRKSEKKKYFNNFYV